MDLTEDQAALSGIQARPGQLEPAFQTPRASILPRPTIPDGPKPQRILSSFTADPKQVLSSFAPREQEDDADESDSSEGSAQ